ncbi:MAG: DUF2723 domain-containing protein [Anaerolineales bacterium]|nr:DUF2723 domain-containing protein [Anaerolineales bacterium]
MRESLNRLDRTDYALALALAGLSFFIYHATLTPSLSYLSPDGNELATIPYVLALAHMPGYPFYTWLGKLFTWIPAGDVAHRMNLMSAVLGALGVGGLYLIITMMLHPRTASLNLRRAGALLAATMFAFSPTFWSQAVITEVYAPNIATVALTLILLLRWERTNRDCDFFLFTLIFGLSLGMHISNLGFAPAFALYVLLVDRSVLKRPTWWLAALSGFGIGMAQFLWLPLRANTLNDRIMVATAPTTLKGIYNYTLGAFPQLKFAFTLGQLPDRVVVYLYLLGKQFGRLSILLGVLGLISLLLRRTRHYFLLIGMYIIHVWFFVQYRAFDLDVFFLPAHFLWAIFLAFAFVEILKGLEAFMAHFSHGEAHRVGRWTLACVTVALGIIPLSINLPISDRSLDVAINDFYANVWEILPENSVLLTRGGVFGYDAFYWRMVYDTRPDVLLPALPTPNPSQTDLQGKALYSTTPLLGRNRTRGPGALPKDLIPPDSWQVPLLIGVQNNIGGFGNRNRLTLYRISKDPPALVLDHLSASRPMDVSFGGLSLVGAILANSPIESGGQLQLVLNWKLDRQQRFVVTTMLDGQALESHELGFGNLKRYQSQVGPVLGRVIVEDYAIVIPSTTRAGSHTLSVRIEGLEEAVEIGTVEVVNEEEAMERWLKIAG